MSAAGLSPGIGEDPIRVIRLEFGEFPEISRLNPRFVAGRERMKLTLDVLPGPGVPPLHPAAFVKPLEAILPSLARHRCCGENRIQESNFSPERRRALAGRDGPPGDAADEAPEEAVDVAHLFEHLLIDFSHYIADMKSCSGVTCGYVSPRSRCDLFVESPGRGVSRLGVDLGLELMNSLLRGGAPDPVYGEAARLARHFHRHPFEPVTAPEADRLLCTDGKNGEDGDDGDAGHAGHAGDVNHAGDAGRALGALRASGFIREIESSMNFSRVAIYRLDARRGSTTRALDLDSGRSI